MGAVGLVVAAGGIAVANEVFFAGGKAVVNSVKNPGTAPDLTQSFNWRLVPATALLALTLGGLETVTPGFAKGLAGLVLLSVLVIPYGAAGTPIDNVVKTLGY